MDKRTQFYLDCLKFDVGLSRRKINLKNVLKVTQSDEYNATLNGDGIYIGEGQVEGTWVAVYAEAIDEEIADIVDLTFNLKPTESTVRYIQYLLSIENYLCNSLIKPYVEFNGAKTHWTVLPFETPEEKWEEYILLRDQQDEKRRKKLMKK